MTKQIGCVTYDDLCSSEELQANLPLIATNIVCWAGELTDTGEWVGGIGEQNARAARNLRLPIGVIERARAGRSGPDILPVIWGAYQSLLVRISIEPPQVRWTAPIVDFNSIRRTLKEETDC